MTSVAEFDNYVKFRLEEWGREFCLARDFTLLGHRSKDILQVLRDHKGEMPPRVVGFKPEEIPPVEWQTECVVTDIARENRDLAMVLRAYYCGTGRRRVERYEAAQMLCGRTFTLRQFYTLHDLGFHRVAGALSALARAA